MKQGSTSPWLSDLHGSRARIRLAVVFGAGWAAATGLSAAGLSGWTGGGKSALIIPAGHPRPSQTGGIRLG
jgi:hypothetical protein